jgi:hypothetical protein
MKCLSRVAFLITALLPGECFGALPLPKEGLLVPKSEAAAVRQRVLGLGQDPLLLRIAAEADRIVGEWPQARAAIEPGVGGLLDLRKENNPPGFVPPQALESAEKLDPLLKNTAKLGFLYFLTGEPKYARTAAEILDLAGRVPRWGWFNWDGANMPQIHFGMYARSVAFAVDFCWEGWNPSERRRGTELLADRCVEPYWRLISVAPFMAFHHLRTKNQGNNALAGALLASLALGDDRPENRVWRESLVQTYSWIVAHDIGWAGGNLESGGYWEVSMGNLYTAAACLSNARGIDFRAHPGFAEAAWFPVMREATVPPAGAPFDKPYPKREAGLWGIMQHKPIELPGAGQCGAWWYDYAARFPDSPAAYYVGRYTGPLANPHQEGHAELMELLWVRLMAKPQQPPVPKLLFKATDREAMIRSGYASPHTFFSFNGDCFLSARNEVLGCTSGLSWHFPWHQFAATESVLETEGRPFSPSMLITEVFDCPLGSAIATRSGPSNVLYYRRAEQARSYREYRQRTRDVVYVRSADRDRVHDYLLFVDRVAHEGRRWHSFNWHLWDRPGNDGSYEVLDRHTVLARRPNASLLLATLSHDAMTYEQQPIPSQPPVNYMFDHNARLLRSIPGPLAKLDEPVRRFAASQWSAGDTVDEGRRRVRHFRDFKQLAPELRAPLTLTAGGRYLLRMSSRKKNAWVDDNILWVLDADLLDSRGRSVRRLEANLCAPDPLRLTDPNSAAQGATGWREAASYFDAPADVCSARLTLHFAQFTNNGPGIQRDAELWLGDVEVVPVGIYPRQQRETLVTLAMPLENQARLPVLVCRREGERVRAELTHPDGSKDEIGVEADGAVHVDRRGPGGRAELLWKRSASPGAAAGSPLATNSHESQAALRKGLSKLAEPILAERDRMTARGRENLALEAEVTATAVRDPRFDARHVIDNETWEIPIDGVLDYTQGDIETPANGGYGRGEHPSYTEGLTSWPFYVRPTYWLLPPQKTGAITLRLKQSSPIALVRLLNTTNAGLNDYATNDFEVELLDDAEKLVARRAGSFGRIWDGAFRSALVRPAFFPGYGAAFRGMLEPGVKVPFGSGWQEIKFQPAARARSVRVNVLSYWAMGGGLNEVQVYAE